MGRALALLLTAGAGVLVATQAPINGHLGEHVGRLQAAFISFLVGTVFLFVLLLLLDGGFPKGSGVGELPLTYFAGGLLGAGYVVTAIITVKVLGAGGITAATITGQLTAAVLIDQFGAFGLDRHPVTWQRLAGLLLLGLGTWLVVSGRR